jgi:tetratricopeptide (TPR) repeat protein
MTAVAVAPRGPRDELEALCTSGRYADALEWYRAHPAGELETPQARLLAATAAARVGEFALAETLSDAALGAFDESEDRQGRVRTLNLLGGIAFERGRLAEAETHYREVAQLARRLGDPLLVARAWNNLANIAHLRGQTAAARELYLQALDTFERQEDVRGIAQTRHNLGLVFRELGDRERAEQHATEAVLVAGRASDPGLHAVTFLGRAELLLAYGELTGALRDLRDGYALATRAGDRFAIADAHRLQALLALRRGNFQVAQAQASLGYQRAVEIGAPVLAAECEAALARAVRAQGRPEEAETRMEQARETLRGLQATQASQRIEREWSAAVS